MGADALGGHSLRVGINQANQALFPHGDRFAAQGLQDGPDFRRIGEDGLAEDLGVPGLHHNNGTA